MKMVNSVLTYSAPQTKKLGEKLSKEIIETASAKKAVVLALRGELGTGKTTFLQGFAKGLGIKDKILSPTFILMRKFPIPLAESQIPKFKNFYHFDCYRIKEPKGLLDLGFKKIISMPQNIVAIEWSDRVRRILPASAIKVKFSFIDKNTRKITL